MPETDCEKFNNVARFAPENDFVKNLTMFQILKLSWCKW